MGTQSGHHCHYFQLCVLGKLSTIPLKFWCVSFINLFCWPDIPLNHGFQFLCIYLQLISSSQVKQVGINWSWDLEFVSDGSVSLGRWRRIKIRSGRVGNEQWIRTEVRVINPGDSFQPLQLWPESTMPPNFLSECSPPKVDSTFGVKQSNCFVETLVVEFENDVQK